MTGFFDVSGFPPRWECGDWPPLLGWLTITSDLVIFAAYTAIPLTIILYLKRRREVPFPHLFWLFCAFIFSCGTTHLIEAVIFWHPIYPVQGLLKAFTAVVSIAAVVATARTMPAALAVPGLIALNQRLQGEIAANAQSQAAVREMTTRLEEKRRRLDAAQTAAALGDWTYEPDSQQIMWSEQIFRLHERDPQHGPPRTFAENLGLYTESGAAALGQAMAEINAGAARVEVDLEVALPSGRPAWHHAILHADRLPDGTIRRLWGTAQDVTRQKLDLIEMERRAVEMERVNRQLEQFAYIASHDLLEPLRKMRFFADMIEEEVRDRLSDEGRDAMRRFGSASERMSRLVRDLLAFARAGKSLSQTVPVELAGVVSAAIENLDRQCQANQVEVTIGELPRIQGDPVLLTQVFQNLFANAIRYRHPGRAPRIVVAASPERRMVRIEVRDNGLGFAADQARRLFEPFVRLHPQIDSEGTGIGLAICLRIIEAHGGTISAAPGPEVGAIFTILLPASQDAIP